MEPLNRPRQQNTRFSLIAQTCNIRTTREYQNVGTATAAVGLPCKTQGEMDVGEEGEEVKGGMEEALYLQNCMKENNNNKSFAFFSLFSLFSFFF